MNVNFIRNSNFLYGKNEDRIYQGSNLNTNYPGINQIKKANAIENTYGMSASRMLSQNTSKEQGRVASDIVSESLGYSNTLRTQRSKTKDAALQIKKLQYDFKRISSQILRSKTSNDARQAAGKARREVIRLKRQRQSGEYDDEELQSAIAHAQAMERIARKKMRHLQEEEMVKASGGLCLGSLEENEEQEESIIEEINYSDAEEMQEAVTEEMQLYQEMLQEMMQETMQEMSDELMEQMMVSLDELGGAAVDTDMDPADFKMMKIKHRSEEMKAIAKADGEYLKAVFERYEKAKESVNTDIYGSSGNVGQAVTPIYGLSSAESVNIAGNVSISIDISV
ncbi:MAG: hypothetical protein ACI4GD_07560 [Lachnospiraceae bacterium]